MKLKRTLIYGSSIILICLLNLSCNAQKNIDTLHCSEAKDIYNRTYQLNCYKGKELVDIFYIDTIGNKINVCKEPDEQALLFKDETEFIHFVSENLVWKTDRDIEGKVYIILYIDETGIIIEKRVVKIIDVCPECTASAIDLVDKIKPQRPALKNGKPVKSIKSIIIPFK